MDNVLIKSARSYDELWTIVNSFLPLQLKALPVAIVIIDSVAALLRADFGLDEQRQKASSAVALGHRLHELSAEFGVPFVCVNQVCASQCAFTRTHDLRHSAGLRLCTQRRGLCCAASHPGAGSGLVEHGDSAPAVDAQTRALLRRQQH